MSSADAVDREVAWLTSVDSLPALLESAGGPWQVVQAYWPRTFAAKKTGIYVMRSSLDENRFANQRKMTTFAFRAKLWWPVGATTTSVGISEAEQRAFDAATELLLARVRGTTFDHTHGGAFLSAAEGPGTDGRISVRFADPEQTMHQNPACLRAEATWLADDRDFAA